LFGGIIKGAKDSRGQGSEWRIYKEERGKVREIEHILKMINDFLEIKHLNP
jgi:hypothetical protein